MLKLFALIIGIAHAQAALSPSYVIYPNQAACLQRSQQMCQAMACDGVKTIYWWSCDAGPLQSGVVGPNAVPAGSYAMRIEAIGAYSASTSNSVSKGVQGLTAQEQSSLVTATQIAPVLPVVTQSAVAK